MRNDSSKNIQANKSVDRDELHERVMFLKREVEAGRIKLPRGSGTAESLLKVRHGSNGKVDPDTVDAYVRALALAAVVLREREELKKIPLIDVQAKYFRMLDDFFGQPFSQMRRHNLSPHTVAQDVASRDKLVKVFAQEADEFAAQVGQFWELYAPVVHAHLEDLRALKSTFGGDIFPSYTSNIACSVGLYIDTVILPDPLLRMAGFFSSMRPEAAVYYIVKHGLNALNYRELALADVYPPAVVIVPGYLMLDNTVESYLKSVSEADLVTHCSRLFGRTFSGEEDMMAFFEQFDTPAQVATSVADASRLLFDTDWSGPADEQLSRYLDEVVAEHSPQMAGQPVGVMLYFALFGRMMQINDLVFNGSQYGAVPLVEAATSWQYLVWKYEYDRERASELNPALEDVVIVKALLAEGSRDLGLLCDLPVQALIDLRRQGALAELRDIIRQGIADIDSASPDVLAEATETVAANIGEAFAKHKKDLEAHARARRRFFGLDVGSWITVGAISVAAASTASVPLSILAASLAMTGAPSGKDLLTRGKEILSTGHDLKRSPTGILFRHTKPG